MRALVTGAAGFVGGWVLRELSSAGWDLWGGALEPPRDASARDDGVHWLACDVRRDADIRAALDAARPDAIVHLAGLAFVPAADADPGAALEANILGAGRLLGQVRQRRAAGTLDPIVLIVGSAEQYGRHDASDQPLVESAVQRPIGIYAASKAAQEVLALEANRAAGVRVIATRPFNHSGSGQASRFLLPALVGRALSLKGTKDATLPLGNTTTIRDFLHVADVARAYRLLLELGVSGEAYNIASGTGVDVATVAERVLALTSTDAKLRVDPTLVRPVEVPVLVGDATKLRAATGWQPVHGLDTIIEDLIRAATH